MLLCQVSHDLRNDCKNINIQQEIQEIEGFKETRLKKVRIQDGSK